MGRGKKKKTSKFTFFVICVLIIFSACYLFREHQPFIIAGGLFIIGLWIYYLWRKLALASTMSEIDSMDGYHFEKFLTRLFSKHGYIANNVGAGGSDFGADVIIEKDGQKIAVQAKNYDGAKVSNDAVQQAVAAASYYGCTRAMVVTNSFFTSAAKKQAQGSRIIPVLLWDRKALQRAIEANRIKLK